jgi:WD40 repeat protein
MGLSAGDRLGPYEVVGLLGAGGMGEVYRARDPRLGREVAVKVLPEDVARDPERLSRFEREARAVAALSHPNILTVFDVGTHEGVPYVVTELLEGETLRELVSHRAPTQRQVLFFLSQAAHGLEAAHAKGIVHRDVKPENLFVTADGRVKLLDFGLAKQLAGVSSGSGEATESSPTGAGQVVGTVAYMSPEQVRGLPVDHRTDLFSFGVVAYELLGGKHPFRRETTVATLTAILEETPSELTTVGRGVPPVLSGIVQRCLSKGREERFRSAHDLALSLESVLSAPAGAASLDEVEIQSPYPGLLSFTERDAGVFFGREAEVRALWDRLRSRHLSGVIGPSGAGKTSFVRAGIVAARPEGWGTLVCTPGASPFRGLGQALGPELAASPDALRKLAGFDDPATAFDLVGGWRRSWGEALLVVDQCEELFTLNPAEAQQRFAALLGRLAREADVHVLLSLRDDFLMKCADHEALARVFESLSPLPALSAESLRRALEEPARKRGYRFEDEALVAEMVEAVEGARAALPLLAFAVSRLWEERDRERKLLTRAAYEEIGGVAGALAQHAEATMDRIGAERQAVVREIFRNLATAQGTRAAADREELLSVFPDRKAAEGVLRALVDARLLTSFEVEGKEGEPSRHRIEIAHESLLKAWPRLVRWQMQDEEGAVLRDQLKQAAHLWDEKGRSPDLLWSGTSVEEYEQWRGRYTGALTAVEELFARAMTERARRTRKLRRAAVVAALVGLSAVAIVVSVSRHQAVAAARKAEASRLVALGRLELEADPTLTLAWARKSLEVADSAEARRLAVEALWRGPVARVLPYAETRDTCTFVSASPDGQWLTCSGWGSVVTLFSADGRTARALANNANTACARLVLFADDSRRLATSATCRDPEAVVWSVDGKEVARLRPGGILRRFAGDELVLREQPLGSDRRQWAFTSRRIGSPESQVLLEMARWEPSDLDAGRGLFVHARDRVVLSRPLEASSGTSAETRVGEHQRRVTGVQVHEGTGWIVSVDEGREARVWDGSSGRLLRTLQGLDPDEYAGSPVLDTRGTLAAWQSLRERAYLLWDLAGPPGAEPLRLHKSEVAGGSGNGVFTGDAGWLATSFGTKVALWPLNLPWPRLVRGSERSGFAGAAFTPDARQMVSCGSAARLRPVVPDAAPERPIGPPDFPCAGVAMDPAGQGVLLLNAMGALWLAPLDGGPADALLTLPFRQYFGAQAADAVGRWAVAGVGQAPDPKDRVLHVVDRRTRATKAFPLPESAGENGFEGGVVSLRFAADGRLFAVGHAGLHRWNVETGANEALHRGPCGPMEATPDGRRIVVGCNGDEPGAEAGGPQGRKAVAEPPYDLLVIDAATGERRRIGTHGRDFVAIAVAPSGDVLATADTTGVVRVGRLDGGEPHLLIGAGGRVTSLAFSPDGRWVASTAGNDIRLWPMPDLTKPPLHTLRHEALVATRRATLRRGRPRPARSARGARIAVGEIGEVQLEPATRAGLVDAGERSHRLALARGVMHATIWAPPGQFRVETPSAVAVDLGCRYTLEVADDGSGLLRVEAGWVGFESRGLQSLVPAGAACPTRRGIGPGTPYREAAPEALRRALAEIDFGADPTARGAAACTIDSRPSCRRPPGSRARASCAATGPCGTPGGTSWAWGRPTSGGAGRPAGAIANAGRPRGVSLLDALSWRLTMPIGRTLLVSALALAPAVAQAGPPLLCFPMTIGDAPSLAWGPETGWKTPRPDYDRARLAGDTLSLLGPQTPVLVRMETLRRAVIYASTDAAAAKGLFDALRARAGRTSGGKADPLARFDLGYAVEAHRQPRHLADRLLSAGPPEDGYALVRQALAARGTDPEMAYAAALITCDRARRGLADEHLKVALAGAREGSDLARTLATHQPLWGDRIQTLRAAAAR